MDFVKLVYKNTIIIALKSVTRSLDSVKLLEAEAHKDFPKLGNEKIEINRYSEGDLKDTYGIEFERPIGSGVPAEYIEIGMVPLYY